MATHSTQQTGKKGPVVALDKKTRTLVDHKTGHTTELPALHPTWCRSRAFLPHPATASGRSNHAELLELIDKDLEWLLQLSHEQFWNQVIFDQSLPVFLDGYLQQSPRDVTVSSPAVAKAIHKKVFLVFLRMSTHKESPEHIIGEGAFGEILYSNFLFDVPRIMDLCVLYGASNRPLLGKMVANVFKLQPRYCSDLNTAIQGTVEALDRTAAQVHSVGHSMSLSSAEKIEDIILFLSDTGQTLGAFVDVYPEAAIFFWKGGAVMRLLAFYEEVMPLIQHMWKTGTARSNAVKGELRAVKTSWMDLLHSVLQHCLIASDQCLQSHEEMVSFLANLLAHTSFVRQFQRQYDMAELVTVVTEAQKLDDTNKEYIGEVVAAALAQAGTQPGGGARKGGERQQREGKKNKNRKKDSKTSAPASQMPSSNAESSDSEFAAVTEVFPQLAGDYITSCLRKYGSSSAVITALLEGVESSDLHVTGQDQGDRKLQEKSPSVGMETPGVTMDTQRSVQNKKPPNVAKETSLLEARHGIYDNDEFDVFRQTGVDQSRVHRGKRGVSAAMLDDKMDDFKDRIVQEYDLIADEYEDEYDDTYDSLAVNVTETAKGDHLKKFNMNDSEESDEGGKEGDGKEGARDGKVVARGNPNRDSGVGATRWSRDNSGGGGGDHQELADQPPTSEVAPRRGRGGRGRGSRGRGQPPGEQELRQRSWQEKNKSFVGNHSRKSAARKKQQRGML